MAASIEQLRAFQASVDRGSFGAAARSLGKAHSTISNLIHYLEIELDTPLFIRHGRSVELTEAGRELSTYAAAVLQDVDRLHDKAQSLKAGIPSGLVVAIDSSIWSPRIATILAQLQQQFPQLKLEIRCAEAVQINHWLMERQADLGLILNLTRNYPGILRRHCFHFNILTVAAPSHPLCRQPIDERELRQHQQIVYRALSEVGLDQLQQYSYQTLTVSSSREALDLTIAGIGWSHVIGDYVQEQLRAGLLQQLRFNSGEKSDQWSTELCWHEDRAMDPALNQLIELLSELPNI